MSTTPLISIILPTLNTVRFLPARLESIFSQTMRDWELLVVDSYSNDGSWEMLTAAANQDARISCWQTPPGLYQAWNFGLSMAKGKYVYFATADDTMREDCLAIMSRALETHSNCDICDSILRLIDIEGNEINENNGVYPPQHRLYDFPCDKVHIRQAPHDYFLHLGGMTVYTSITQIMIRKNLFEATGPFPTVFSICGDYCWGIGASLQANVIFIPEKIASWRIHPEQATSLADPDTICHNYNLMLEAADSSLANLSDRETSKKARQMFRLMRFKADLLPARRTRSWSTFLNTVLATGICQPSVMLNYIWNICRAFVLHRNFRLIHAYEQMIKNEVEKLRLDHYIQICGGIDPVRLEES